MSVCCSGSELADVADIVRHTAPRQVMLFTGGSSYLESGAADLIDSALDGIALTRVSDVAPNPTIEAIESAIDRHTDTSPDLIVAVGGGSVIDLAKSVRVLAPQPTPPLDIILAGGSGIAIRPVPLIAIPTTAGTGSEVTHFSVVYVDGTKHSLAHEWVRPDHAVLDPTLTYSASPNTTAVTGLDALTQAIESLWSARSTETSMTCAREAMRLAIENLHTAVVNPDPSARAAMARAAHLAGHAIDETTTTAPHALSYHLTSTYGIPHGHAVALTLGAVLEFNSQTTDADCVDDRGSTHVRTVIAEVADALGSPVSDARAAWGSFVSSLGLETSLTRLGVPAGESRDRMARSVNTERLAGNPRHFSASALSELVASLP